jgi:hypothetical protein
MGKAKLIATHRGITVAQHFTEMLHEPVDRALRLFFPGVDR